MLIRAIDKHRGEDGLLSKKGFVSALAEILPVTRETVGPALNYLDSLIRLQRNPRFDSDATKAFAQRFINGHWPAERFNEVVAAEAKLCGLEGLIKESAASGHGITKPELAPIFKGAYGTSDKLGPTMANGLWRRVENSFARCSTRDLAERLIGRDVTAAQAGAILGFTPQKAPPTAGETLHKFFFSGDQLTDRAVTEVLFDALPLTRKSFDEVRKTMFAAANSGTHKMTGPKVDFASRRMRDLVDRWSYSSASSLSERDGARRELEKNILGAFIKTQVKDAVNAARESGQGVTRPELIKILEMATKDETQFHASAYESMRPLYMQPDIFARAGLAKKAEWILKNGGPADAAQELGVAIQPAFPNKLSGILKESTKCLFPMSPKWRTGRATTLDSCRRCVTFPIRP